MKTPDTGSPDRTEPAGATRSVPAPPDGPLARPRQSRVTIFDVAKAVGVSTSTVSRVVNGRHEFMSAATRAKVEAAMDRLGYIADPRARGLAGGRTGILGVVVHDVASSYIAKMVRAVDLEVAAREYGLMLATTHTRIGSTTRYVDQLMAGIVDGLLVVAPPDVEEVAASLRAKDFPHVVVDHDGPPLGSSVVRAANRHGIHLAVEHLTGLGHRRIGFLIGDSTAGSAQVRLAAFREAVAQLRTERGIPVHASEEQASFHEADGYEATRRLLAAAPRPTAIVASADATATGTLRAARELGLSVPGDLSVVGFDDIPEARLVTPALTTVHQPIEDIGRVSVRLLFEHIADPALPVRVVEMATSLVERDSTAPPR